MTRSYKLKVAILRILKDAGALGFPVREDDLHNELTLCTRPAPMASETALLIQELDREKRIVGVRDGEILRLSITPAGEAWYMVQVSG